jgi:hypothetical protein
VLEEHELEQALLVVLEEVVVITEVSQEQEQLGKDLQEEPLLED